MAQKIKDAEHAGIAKSLSRKLPKNDDLKKNWHSVNKELMRELLTVKSQCSKAFRDALLESGDSILAEASTNDLFWGTGLSPYMTSVTKPEFWPGQNMLGAMLIELREKLLDTAENEHEVDEQDAGNEVVKDSQDEPEDGEIEAEDEEEEESVMAEEIMMEEGAVGGKENEEPDESQTSKQRKKPAKDKDGTKPKHKKSDGPMDKFAVKVSNILTSKRKMSRSPEQTGAKKNSKILKGSKSASNVKDTG